ncbi:TonB-dependent receptor [Lewinellaceae bacterium SD302]|nr:TonB-dependent receptor [Lewinellaceae bacterium SD302]
MRILFLLSFILSVFSLAGQSTLRGKVVSEDGQSVMFATVAVADPDTDEILGAVTTDIEGAFEVEVDARDVYLEVSYLGYEDRRIDKVELSESTVNLGRIEIKENAEVLEEVVVTAERSSVEIQLDKRVFNVGKDISARGGSALSVLENVPSVQVDVEGNVSLRGNNGVRILINGRPNGLVGEGGQGLRALTADMIEKVEVITNPSARYEAEGATGIINIVLKKDRSKGFNGAFNVNAGLPESYGGAANLNYRSGKLNWFTNYGLNYRTRIGGGGIHQEVYGADGTFITFQDRDRNRTGLNHNFRVGADFYPNDKTVLTLAGRYNRGRDNNDNTTIFLDYLDEQFLERTIRTDDELEREEETEISLKFSKKYEQKGREWTADIRFQDETETEGSDLNNFVFGDLTSENGTLDIVQRSDNKESNRNLIFQTDYIHPVGAEGRAEVGVRIGLRDIANDFGVSEVVNGVFEPLEGLTNEFFYNENIYAAYFIYGNKAGNLSYQFGLRPEYTDVVTELKTTEEVNARDYMNWFPSVNLGYEISPASSLQFSYSRRVNRPRFRDLNPFFSFSDNRNFRSGNPDLNPEFSSNFEFGYLKTLDKGNILGSIYYRHTTGVIERIQIVNQDGTSVSQPENLATRNNYGLEINGNYQLTRWWRLNADFNLFQEEISGGDEFPQFNASTLTWFTRGTSQFEFSDKTEGQIRFNYRAPRNSPQGRRLGVWSADLAASQEVFAGSGTLTLSVRDVFNTRRWRWTTFGNDFFQEGDFQWQGTVATLTLNYRLNQEKGRGK